MLVRVPAGVEQCVQLQRLHLYRNRLPGALPQALASLTRLTVLNVSHNQLTEISVATALPELEVLVASYNRLTSVPAELLAARRLRELAGESDARTGY